MSQEEKQVQPQQPSDYKARAVIFLVVSVTLMFFTLLLILATHEVPASSHDLFLTMVGSLGTSFGGIVGYYFGSSASSDKKTDMLGNNSK